MKKLFVAACFLFAAVAGAKAQSNISSQDYKTAAGVKFYPGAITVKHFLDGKSAVEGIGYFYNHGTRITGLYELHYDIKGAPINLSLDWQPSFEFGSKRNKGFNGDWGGLAIRYVF